ncbi:MAG TPA: nucleotide exchange factor GrpE [Candidatus Paceibacterota bacterium]
MQDNNEDFSVEESDEDGDAPVGKDVVKKLRERLKKCEEESKEYLTGWQRAKADYVNLKRETEDEKLAITGRAKKRIIHDVLPVLDSFQIAFANKTAWGSVDKNWRMGVEYIYSQLLSILEEHGVTQINESGVMFDPLLHHSNESVLISDKGDDGKVLEILQTGYKINNHIIRPARVKIGTYHG